MSIKDFINGPFKEYANYDNERNIPDLMDGLKTSQRKVLWTFIKDIGKEEIIVDRAAMRAAAYTFYRHGGQNLYDVITNMAQNFPGSNNVNLLEPLGQFGTRMVNSASSPRYISTKLNDNFNKLFEKEDFDILTGLVDEGQVVEPAFLLPKLPLNLINGSTGIGNGFSAKFLQYNPKDIAKAVLEVVKYGVVKTKLKPWINGFKGAILKDPITNQVLYSGLIERLNSNTLVITELPPGYQLEGYKAVLNQLIEDKVIKDYDNKSTEAAWRFVIDAPRALVASDLAELLNTFSLIQKESETLTAWLPDGNIKAYKTIEDVVVDWTCYRLEFYEERRLNQISKLDEELSWLKIKLKFIQWWNENSHSLVKLRQDELHGEIEHHVTMNPEFIERLMSLRISSLGIEQVDRLIGEIKLLDDEKAALEAITNDKIMVNEIKAIKL